MTGRRIRDNKIPRFRILMFRQLPGNRIHLLQFYAVILGPSRQISKSFLELDHSRFLRHSSISGEGKWGNSR